MARRKLWSIGVPTARNDIDNDMHMSTYRYLLPTYLEMSRNYEKSFF